MTTARHPTNLQPGSTGPHPVIRPSFLADKATEEAGRILGRAEQILRRDWVEREFPTRAHRLRAGFQAAEAETVGLREYLRDLRMLTREMPEPHRMGAELGEIEEALETVVSGLIGLRIQTYPNTNWTEVPS